MSMGSLLLAFPQRAFCSMYYITMMLLCSAVLSSHGLHMTAVQRRHASWLLGLKLNVDGYITGTSPHCWDLPTLSESESEFDTRLKTRRKQEGKKSERRAERERERGVVSYHFDSGQHGILATARYGPSYHLLATTWYISDSML